jgi:pyridoxine kinase
MPISASRCPARAKPAAAPVFIDGKKVKTLRGDDISRAVQADRRRLLTSAPAMRRNSVSNLLVDDKSAIAAEHGAIADAPNGTGDLMAALFTANLLAGHPDETALKRSAASVFELVARSVKRGSRDLLVAWEQAALVQPMALVSSRRVMDAPIRA